MMTMAKGTPMPTAPPITIAIAKSKPAMPAKTFTLLPWKESFRLSPITFDADQTCFWALWARCAYAIPGLIGRKVGPRCGGA